MRRSMTSRARWDIYADTCKHARTHSFLLGEEGVNSAYVRKSHWKVTFFQNHLSQWDHSITQCARNVATRSHQRWCNVMHRRSCNVIKTSCVHWEGYPVSILYKSTVGRYRPVSYPDGPITARCSFIKNASWVCKSRKLVKICFLCSDRT